MYYPIHKWDKSPIHLYRTCGGYATVKILRSLCSLRETFFSLYIQSVKEHVYFVKVVLSTYDYVQ